MEARLCRLLLVLVALCSVAAGRPNNGATVRTRNFVVTSPSAEISKQVAEAAEVYRKEIAIEWLGHELLPWYAPCPIFVKVGQIGAGGATTFSFHASQNGPDEVCGWDMQIQGSLERILDSVLPHEISHTIFACHFRRPLPRWADEGAATLIEHESERKRQVMTVRQVLNTRRRIPLKTLLALKEYPRDPTDIMTLYAEGYSLADLLVQKGGKARYLKFLNDAHQRGWEKAIQAQYGFKGVDDLEKQWHEWIIAGSPTLKLPEGQQLAQADATPKGKNAAGFEMRGQSPEPEAEARIGGDPFLETTVAETAAPRRRTLPTTNGELAQAPRRPGVKTVTAAEVVHDDWVPEDAGKPSSAPQVAEADVDDDLWVEVPRSKSRTPRRGNEEKRQSKPQVATGRSGAGELPSVVRQRQALPVGVADTSDSRGRRPRTPWSEFPQEAPVGWGGAVEGD
jgi:hypothetical protein